MILACCSSANFNECKKWLNNNNIEISLKYYCCPQPVVNKTSQIVHLYSILIIILVVVVALYCH